MVYCDYVMVESFFKLRTFPKNSIYNIINAKLRKIDKFKPFLLKTLDKNLKSIFKTHFRGLALDFDGTLIPLKDRYQIVESSILRILLLLNRKKFPIFILTGRGKSIFQQIPFNEFIHINHIIIVQYNGGRLRYGNQDLIKEENMKTIKNYCEVKMILDKNEIQYAEKVSGFFCQTTFGSDQIFNAIQEKYKNWNVLNTKYSFDIVPSHISKGLALKYSSKLFCKLKNSLILKIGDSGDINGNDYSFLKMKNSFSVGDYSSDLNTNFPVVDENNIHLKGPDGLRYLFSYFSI
ncbi:MAG: hypothetical protein CEE43_13480 [Promethearchaeota archaeon Loki_b32]|nr:MAG: hypothetical protein CEE43_13480 [Candidatus Lokiarchaeota archaeon Loki_b32]